MITLFVFLLTMVPTPPEQRIDTSDTVLRRRACSQVVVKAPGKAPSTRRMTWRARDAVDLELSTRVQSSTEARNIEFRVYTPAGHLYETFAASITRGSAAAARLPVSGTAITQRGLYGHWKVVPHFEGDLAPCGQARSFGLMP
jgi:hypothetical protein